MVKMEKEMAMLKSIPLLKQGSKCCAIVSIILFLAIFGQLDVCDAFLPGSTVHRSTVSFGERYKSSMRSFAGRTDRFKLGMSDGKTGGNSQYDYDLIVVGCGVGGHGAALHARANGMKTAVLTGNDVGGTCVNRGCVPSKALLAASGRVREMKDAHHLKSFGISVGDVSFDRQGVANHATQLANNVKNNLEKSLKGHGCDVIHSLGALTAKPHEVLCADTGKIITAQNIVISTGSVPTVPRGVVVDEKTVCTSDSALRLEFMPQYVAIIGSGYIGLEFCDVYTALGADVTLIEALDTLMPTFDPDVRKIADRVLIKPRNVDSRVGVFASEVTPGEVGVKPVTIKMIDAKTKEHKETIEVDLCLVATGRSPNTKHLNVAAAGVTLAPGGFIPTDAHMRVLRKPPASPSDGAAAGDVVEGLYCIGDANGKLMLAHAASAQGISAIENMMGRSHAVNHAAIPAACFTHPEIAFVGLSEDQANAKSKAEGFKLGKKTSHFKANSKALAENEPDGICKILYNQDSGELLGVHIIGIHAADLIQECANAIAAKTTVKQLAMTTHTHPTLSEVLDAAFKSAVGMAAH